MPAGGHADRHAHCRDARRKLAETAAAEQILREPREEYTELLAAVPAL